MLKLASKTSEKFLKSLAQNIVKEALTTAVVEGIKASVEVWKKRQILTDDLKLKAEAKADAEEKNFDLMVWFDRIAYKNDLECVRILMV